MSVLMESHLSDRSLTSELLINKSIYQQLAKLPCNVSRPSISSDCAVLTDRLAAGPSADPVLCLQSKRIISIHADQLQSSQVRIKEKPIKPSLSDTVLNSSTALLSFAPFSTLV